VTALFPPATAPAFTNLTVLSLVKLDPPFWLEVLPIDAWMLRIVAFAGIVNPKLVAASA